MKVKNSIFQTLTLCASAPLRETNLRKLSRQGYTIIESKSI